MIHEIMKNGMNFGVRSVIIASSASPTESMPTKLSIQKIKKPARPNLRRDFGQVSTENTLVDTHLVSKSAWKALLNVE